MRPMYGVFDIEVRTGSPRGPVAARRRVYNGITTAALDYLHLVGLNGAAVSANHGVSAILNSGFTAVDPSDLATAHPGWTDLSGATGGIERLTRNPLAASGGAMTLQPYDAGSSIFVPNGTFLRGASLYLHLTTGTLLSPGSLLFCTAVLPDPLYAADANPANPYVFVRVGYVLRGTPFDPA